MTGRSRLEIGTYGDISTIRTGRGTIRAEARYRDGDGMVRKVTASAATAKQAKQSLRLKLQRRNTATGFGVALSPESTVAELAAAWIEDVRVRTDLAAGTKDLYRRELTSLVLPTFDTFRLREVTTGRVDQFLKRQSLVSYAHARHSRVVLNLMFNYALRHDALHRNPVAGTARLKQPVSKPVALSLDELQLVRQAVASWRSGPSVSGPRPDGQVQDVIEVMLGTSDRIGEALALRKSDVDDTTSPMQVTVAGTLVVIRGRGVYRQDHPKTSSSHRILQVPDFTAEVLRRRLGLLEDADGDHLIFHTRVGTPLAPNNVRRTLRKMLEDAGLADLKVTPHTFRRTAGTVIARASDVETAADVLGNSPEVAKKHYIQPEEPKPIASPALYLQGLAPRRELTAARRT
ncbi:tyrosine-type recombinase/integrase [Agromyces sp. NPDC058484]|uniref:tyrosine-type recombinase/integrase n=1 Tax=Agromyces sp. NPDC058484 TaxID=3346524 RepID=UPI003665DF4E